jgi:hypothetical protein
MPHGFIPVPNVASVELIYSVNGITAENVFHVQKGSPYTLAQLQALRTTVNGWDAASWAGSRCGGALLTRIRTKALDTSASPTEDYTLPVARGGTVGGPLLPSNATFAMKLVTGLAGRSFRGRLYVVGIGSVFLGATANQVSLGTATTFLTLLTNLITVLAAAGHTLGVVSYRSGGVYRPTGLFTPAIGWTYVDLNMDSMRRRLTGRGI